MPHPLVGKPAPPLTTLHNYDGEVYEFIPEKVGAPTALFFFPKAGTYGCTREVCQFRDALVDETVFKDSKLNVIGVSPDPVDKLKAFAEKHNVTYPILSDEKGDARKAYCPGKGLFGLTEARVTYFINQDGTVRDALDATVNYGAHVKFVSKCLAELEEEKKKDAEPAASEPAPAAAAATDAPATDAAPAAETTA